MGRLQGLLDRQWRGLREFVLPRRQQYYPSPDDWSNEVLYFLLPDRFSDGQEHDRPLLDRSNLAAARPSGPDGSPWRWEQWFQSGGDRFQGGTLRGIISKLDYLDQLGITALWIAPVFRQRARQNSYHGYGIQNFLDVDPRLGSRADLIELVQQAHLRGIRVILDIIFNHSGANWLYRESTPGGIYTPPYQGGSYDFGGWRSGRDDLLMPEGSLFASLDDGVFPEELQRAEYYTRAGMGDLGAGHLDDPHAEHKRSDFFELRDFRLDAPGALKTLARCYKYWIALTDCDGFRIDTLKHVFYRDAQHFCDEIKEFAANLGKHDFFLVGEIAGGDYNADRYLDVLDRNLNAALDIGEMRLNLRAVASGLGHPLAYFDGFDPGKAVMGSHRNLRRRHVSVLDDHDHVFGSKTRLASEVAQPQQVVLGVAIQLFTLGIPCIYYGTEQAMAGPEPAERGWLPEWGRADRYLREAMFGPRHPRADQRNGQDGFDEGLPGFGPFGTAGQHIFDPHHPIYRRIAALTELRRRFPVLRVGRQYLRPTRVMSHHAGLPGPGELLAWSRLLDDEEALVVANTHGLEPRGAEVLIDAQLNQGAAATLTVVANTAQVADPAYAGAYPVGSQLPVQHAADGSAFVAVHDLPPAELLVLVNYP